MNKDYIKVCLEAARTLHNRHAELEKSGVHIDVLLDDENHFHELLKPPWLMDLLNDNGIDTYINYVCATARGSIEVDDAAELIAETVASVIERSS
ncbi:hypothetical protein B0H94_11856 [Salsuginibacillus halophilus]|uniref:Uncharacterized protein n=1 Tax=Salsuginibacillus halophilus TaxID=517424 RepID=A0A2P8H6B2_9BACI|nr:hypothetical protein [Salsuginibacillus halophilus]PSL41743.1 hypothetical protein B0H94_11856 [Salsuginibacillus halophilus]